MKFRVESSKFDSNVSLSFFISGIKLKFYLLVITKTQTFPFISRPRE